MQEELIREALSSHRHASAAGDANAEHGIYDDDAVCDYPQSGERIVGRAICRPCGVIIRAHAEAGITNGGVPAPKQ